MEIDKIYQGDALEILKQMPNNWLNCIITSPPYWGLRDYGIEGIVWDGDPECPHNFLSDCAYHDNMRFRAGKNTTVGNNINPDIYTIKKTGGPNLKEIHAILESTSQFCSLCGAWRGSLGLEPTFQLYIQHLIQIFDECKRVLRDDGTLWVNLGDTYASNGSQETRFWHGDNPGKHKFNGDGELSKGYSGRCRTNEIMSKSLCDIPFRFSIAMIDNGWIKRNTIIWHKTNAMPASCKDRFTVDFEYVFLFVKQGEYYFEQQFEPIKFDSIMRTRRGIDESNKYNADNYRSFGVNIPTISKPRKFIGYEGIENEYQNHQGRNQRSVWSIPTKPFSEAHFATFPEKLIEPMIKAGCPEFVCLKCGKPREKIYNFSGGTIGKGGWTDHTHDLEMGFRQNSGSDRHDIKGDNPYKIIESGYTNCGCSAGFDSGIVYDPFMGAGTVAVVAKKLNRHWIGSELNADYIAIANERTERVSYQPSLFPT